MAHTVLLDPRPPAVGPKVSSTTSSAPSAAESSRRLGWRDAIALGALGCLLIAFASSAATSRSAPFEDAAMLMRYAVNFASGHGIVWNVGEHPIDGATDLGYMVVLAGVVKLGIGVESAARMLNVGALGSTVLLCYLFARRFHGAGVLLAALTAAFLALGPAVAYVGAGFGAPFFGLFVASMWMAAEHVRRWPRSRTWAFALGVTIVAAGLVRPEGFLIGACCIVGVLIAAGPASRRAAAIAMTVAVAAGLLFLIWRWSYFGSPLPNPYYKKGGERLHVDAFLNAVGTITTMTWPLLAVVIAGLVPASSRRRTAGVLTTVLLFSGLWLLISDEMNLNGRFQYPAAVIVAFAAPGIAVELWRIVRARPVSKRVGDATVAAAFCIALSSGILLASAPTYRDSGITPQVAIARVLAQVPSRGSPLVTTEAGVIPLRSGWVSVDAWGLNDAEIAHHGVITTQRLRAIDPGVIVIHAPTKPGGTPTPDATAQGFLPGWSQMTDVLIRYAEDNQYVLAAAFGARDEPGSWAAYVRVGMPTTHELTRRLSRTKIPNLTNLAGSGASLPTRSRSV